MNLESPPKTVSIIVPCYNEGDVIASFYSKITAVCNSIKDIQFEIICVDDGSKDNTLAQLIVIAQKDERFQIVELSRNFGKEAALTAGLDVATGDAVIPIDADLQDPPELMKVMIDKWCNGAEIVLARRVDRNAEPYLKRKTAELFYHLHNSISTIKIPKNVGDFRLLDRVAVDAIKKLPERQRFMKGLFAWVGFKTESIDFVRDPRAAGNTKFSGFKLWNFALEGVTSFSAVPLKLWSYIGGIGACITLCYAIYIVTRTLIYGIDIPGYASLLVAILFFGSLQLISVGMLGEYISRIYMESKNRPLYLIRKRYGSKS
jgi:glycosyltransferase involved in cell wall biosynthesis